MVRLQRIPETLCPLLKQQIETAAIRPTEKDGVPCIASQDDMVKDAGVMD